MDAESVQARQAYGNNVHLQSIHQTLPDSTQTSTSMSMTELLKQPVQTDMQMSFGAQSLLSTPPLDFSGNADHSTSTMQMSSNNAGFGLTGTERIPGPGTIQDFAALTNNSFMSMLNQVREPVSVGSSPQQSPPTSGGLGPHVSSPSMLGTASFPSASSHMSSLASAFDPAQIIRTPPSENSESPLPHTSASDHGPSSNSTAGSPLDLTSYPFQPPAGPPPGSAGMDSDPQLVAVHAMLDQIAKTAQSASQKCVEGQRSDASSKIGELRKTINLVSQLMATLQIGPNHSPPREAGVRSTGAPTAISLPNSNPPSVPPSLPVSPPQPMSVSSFMPMTSSTQLGQSGLLPDPNATMDMADSRKRCASSSGEERAVKAIKLESSGDPMFSSGLSSSSLTPVAQFSPPSSTLPGGMTPEQAFNEYNIALANSSSAMAQDPLGMLDMPPIPPEFVLSRRNTWSERPPALVHRHTVDSLSGTMPSSAPIMPPSPFTAAGSYGPPPMVAVSNGSDMGSSGMPRTARSMSLNMPSYIKPQFAFGLDGTIQQVPSSAIDGPSMADLYRLPPEDYAVTSSPEEDSEDGVGSRAHSPPRGRSDVSRPSTSGGPSRMSSRSRPDSFANEIPIEFRNEVDRMFFAFLERLCSNLDATDPKGELIHQTLMAKKMQRLDESPDYRPFKFRIQAFTNSFLDDLSQQGYPEEVLPMKKVRHYLWNQPYISRYNEEGKKTKSKGNHIWSIDAKKLADGAWSFRPFRRRLAGQAPAVAYIGIRWSWTPRIWDPQNARSNTPVTFTSPWLPPWLSWNGDTLSGTPGNDAESCEIIVNASFVAEGDEEQLSHKIPIHVSPVNTLDTSGSHLRRPSLTSLGSDVGDPRRVASDTAVAQAASARIASRVAANLAPPVPTSTDAQVVQVLEQAAERVAQESQGQVAASHAAGMPMLPMPTLAAQEHVLKFTAKAYSQATGQSLPSLSIGGTAGQEVADAAKQMVYEAAQVVVVKKQVNVEVQKSAGLIPPNTVSAPVTVNEVSREAQTAVAHALELTGTMTTEVDVLKTARSLLQQEGHAAVAPVNAMRAQGMTPPGSSPPVPFPTSMAMSPIGHSGFTAMS